MYRLSNRRRQKGAPWVHQYLYFRNKSIAKKTEKNYVANKRKNDRAWYPGHQIRRVSRKRKFTCSNDEYQIHRKTLRDGLWVSLLGGNFDLA